jgi:hypothetical protein
VPHLGLGRRFLWWLYGEDEDTAPQPAAFTSVASPGEKFTVTLVGSRNSTTLWAVNSGTAYPAAPNAEEGED